MNIDIEASDYPVVIYYGENNQHVRRVRVPVKATLKNKSFLRKTLHEVHYNFDKSMHYSPNIGDKNNRSVPIYDKYKEISSTRLKHVYYNEPKEFILDLFVPLDTAQNHQRLFNRDKEILIQNNVDSLVIGTMEELKTKHPELVNFINKGELYFRFPRNKSVRTDGVKRPIFF